MVDEQEGCEWMNVSSGTGSPGQTRTKGRKTAVCVCVVVVVVVVVVQTDVCERHTLEWFCVSLASAASHFEPALSTESQTFKHH